VAEPRTRRRPGPVDPEGPEYVPEDVYPEDPTVYEEGPPPEDEPVIVVVIGDEIPPEGISDEEDVIEETADELPYVEPELPPDEEPPYVE